MIVKSGKKKKNLLQGNKKQMKNLYNVYLMMVAIQIKYDIKHKEERYYQNDIKFQSIVL